MTRPAGATDWEAGPGPLSARITTIPGLTNGTTYEFGVYAVSTDGTGSTVGTATATPVSYAGTAVGYCDASDRPVIEAANTGTGDVTFVAGGTGFPLPAGGVITVAWPSDASGPLAQVDWEMQIPGTTDVVESGTLTLPDCDTTTTTTTTTTIVVPAPTTTVAPTTTTTVVAPTVPPAPTTSIAGGGPGGTLPATGPSGLDSNWFALAALAFVMSGSILLVVRRRPQRPAG